MGAGAGPPGELGELDGFGRGVGAGAGDDRHASGRLLRHDLDQLAVFIEIDGRRFTSGTHDDDAIGTFSNMPIDEAPQPGQIETAVLVHRGDDGGQRALNDRCCH